LSIFGRGSGASTLVARVALSMIAMRQVARLFGKARSSQRTYVTYFDSAYAARGIVMLYSLLRCDPAARIFVLALDAMVQRITRDLMPSAVTVITPDELYRDDPEVATKRDRSPWEFYATQKPALARFALETGAKSVISIDADTQFFSRTEPMFSEIGGASVAITPHRFHPATARLAIYGPFNAGCVYWRNDAVGRRCVADWRADCLDWCYETVKPDGRYMNQGYLTQWPARYPNLRIIAHPGVNLAPWNLDGHSLGVDRDQVLVDGVSLIFFHFSGLFRDDTGRWYTYSLIDQNFDVALRSIYQPYLSALEEAETLLMREYGLSGIGSQRHREFGPGYTVLN